MNEPATKYEAELRIALTEAGVRWFAHHWKGDPIWEQSVCYITNGFFPALESFATDGPQGDVIVILNESCGSTRRKIVLRAKDHAGVISVMMSPGASAAHVELSIRHTVRPLRGTESWLLVAKLLQEKDQEFSLRQKGIARLDSVEGGRLLKLTRHRVTKERHAVPSGNKDFEIVVDSYDMPVGCYGKVEIEWLREQIDLKSVKQRLRSRWRHLRVPADFVVSTVIPEDYTIAASVN